MSVSLSPVFNGWQGFTIAGIPMSGGLVNTYLAGTTTPAGTYTSSAGTILNANPIQLDSAGLPPNEIWLTDGVVYKFVVTDSLGLNPRTYDNIAGVGNAFLADLANIVSAAKGSGLVGFNAALNYAARTIGHDAGVYPSIDSFVGVDPTGGSDCGSAINTALAAAGVLGVKGVRFSGTYLTSIAILPPSNMVLEGAGGAVIQYGTADINGLYATGKTQIKVRGIHFKQTTAGNVGEVGGVKFDSCTFCEVSGCEFEGMQWSGVMLNNSNDCLITNNYFHDFLASSAGDKNDIAVYRNSSYNVISYNRCYGGSQSWYGVLCQDPGGIGTYLPQKNKIVRNLVKTHAGYGVVVYIGGSVNSYNEVVGNDIEAITGAAGSFYGSGIYCVGTGLGGLQVLSNNVRNCCSATTSLSNAASGITVTGNASGDLRPVVIGNVVENMTQSHGIFIASCSGGAVVQGNSIRIPSTNNGTGPGGASLVGNGIKVQDSNDVTVDGNAVYHNGTGDALLVIAATANFNRVVMADNVMRTTGAGGGIPIRCDHLAAFIYTDVTISNNQCRTDSTGTSPAISLAAMDRVTLSGNGGGSNTLPAVTVSAVTGLRAANNCLNTNGAVGVTTTGTCTGSYWDKTNSVPGTFTNAATGLLREFFASAVPATGTGAVGDRAEQSAPVVGNPKGWRCTVAGAPGTWVSEGNL